MTTNTRTNSKRSETGWSRGDEVPMTAIRRFAREVAEKFQPDKIILFGSHAYGRPHVDSDVDILVIMPCRNEIDQAYKIRMAVSAPFAMDLIVRKPRNMEWRLAEGDWFLREIVAKGKVLHEAADKRVGKEDQLRGLLRGLNFLTDFAVEPRHPGKAATKRQATSALRWADRVRDACRGLLGI